MSYYRDHQHITSARNTPIRMWFFFKFQEDHIPS